jgi:glutamate synthase (ferredoxin)
MSLEMRLGARGNLLQPGGDAYSQVLLKSPILLESQLKAIQEDKKLGSKTFGLSFAVGQAGAMEHSLTKLCADVEAAVRAGCQCVVLSDRASGGAAAALEAGRAPVPSLLATGAVHHHLIRAGLRSDTSIVVDTAQARGHRAPLFCLVWGLLWGGRCCVDTAQARARALLLFGGGALSAPP